jgi:hypothetical protein
LSLVKIDTQDYFSDVFISLFRFEYLRRSALASLGQPLQHVSSKNAGAGKLGTLRHKIENRIFSLTADDGEAA